MEKKAIFVLLFVTALLILYQPTTQAQTTIISVTNTGDDKGPGYYGYPTNDVFKAGVFRITKFEVITTDTSVIFKTYFSNLGGNPWNGPNGFSMQYVQIYIGTTASGILTRTDTYGLNIALRYDYGWHFALLLAPGWGTGPVPQDQRAALYYSNGTSVVQNGDFKVYAETDKNSIVAEVSKKLLTDIDNISKWKIVVAVASYDGFGPMKVRTAGIKGGEWVLNATKTAPPDLIPKISKAITKGIEPRVLGLVVVSPEYPNGITANQQHEWLNSYDPDKGLLAIVPAFAPTILTTTLTTLIPYTTSIPYTTTVTTTVTDWSTAAGLGIVMLIIGFAVGYILRRPKAT
jgi:carbohydrate-binding DOMON domain-containing protein